MEKVIAVELLCKDYKIRQKEQGIKGSITSFFKPDYIIKRALNEISIDIKQGEIVGFIGPNGAGKTTTLKILSGILYPTKGKAEVLGFIPSQRKSEFLSKIAMVMGNKSQLSWDLPAMDSLILLKNIYTLSDELFEKQMKNLCNIFDVSKLLKQPVRQLSLGERMKCELVASLIHDPKIVFLDEPTLGLDAVSQRNFRQMIKEQNRMNGTTFLITSHYMKDIKELCDRVIIINSGEKVFDGHLFDLEQKYGEHRRVTITLEKNDDLKNQVNKLSDKISITSLSECNLSFNVDRKDSTEIISKLFEMIPIIDISIQEPEIDEIIYNVYRDEGISLC